MHDSRVAIVVGLIALTLCAVAWLLGSAGDAAPVRASTPTTVPDGARAPTSRETTVDVAATPPADPLERAAIPVPPSGLATIRGRLLRVGGDPLADSVARLATDDGLGIWPPVEVRTDSFGAFALESPPHEFEQRLRIRFGGTLGTSAWIPPLGADAVLDLGDLTLAELPVLASGAIQDDLGRPIAGARVEVGLLRRVSADEATNERLEGAVRRERAPNPGLQLPVGAIIDFDVEIGSSSFQLSVWNVDATASTLSDGDGRFVVRGPPPDDSIRVTASADGHLDATTEAMAPGAAVVLVLARTSHVIGHASIPDWLPPDAIEFAIRPTPDGPESTARGQPATGGVDFRIDGLRPGTYALAIRLRGYPVPVMQILDVAVRPGDRPPDPRLAAIDLTTPVRRYEVRAVDDRGRPLLELPSPLLVQITSDETRLWIAYPWIDGRVELFCPADHLEAIAIAPGFRRRELTLYPGAQQLRFETLHPVEVLLPDLRSACGADLRVRVSLVRREGTGLPSGIAATDPRTGAQTTYSRWHLGHSGGAWLGDSDLVEVPLVLPGPYDVIARLRIDDEHGESSITLGQVDVVLEGARPQRAVVSIDSPKVRAMAERVRAQRDG